MEHREQKKNKALSGKKIYRIFHDEYIHWLCNPKWLTVLVLLVLIREIVIVPMLDAAANMGQIVNLLEPAIAVGNSGLILLMLPLFYILLISDCPTISSNLYLLLPRTGRMNWVAGEMLFQLASVITYLAAVIVCSCAQVFFQSFCVNGWSLVVTRYGQSGSGSVGGAMQDLIPMELSNQMPPFQAFFLTFGLLVLYLLLWNGIALLASLYAKKRLAFWVELAVMAVGMAFAALKSKWMWFFPSGHAIVWLHYQKYYRRYVFPVWASFVLFFVVLAVIGVLIYRRAKNVSMDILWEEKTE